LAGFNKTLAIELFGITLSVVYLHITKTQITMTTALAQTCNQLGKREFDPSETLNYFKAHGFLFWSWGASRFTNFNNLGLCFKVNGHHHKGYVFVALDWSDTFDVHIINTQGRVLNTYNEVYIDELFNVIDNRIEKIKEYVR
jgi:hypothetical protein